jgi:hypothetical protein
LNFFDKATIGVASEEDADVPVEIMGGVEIELFPAVADEPAITDEGVTSPGRVLVLPE